MNPELRQTLNAISHNFESANQAAQENIYTFTQAYIDPCIGGIKSCLDDCTAPCFHRGDNYRRKRARERSRVRAENFFDFYDDWDENEMNVGTMAWGDDELDSLLAGRGLQAQKQPERQRTMSYGTRARPKGTAKSADQGLDPTIIPGSSYLGFLESLPWRIGQRVLRYRPSAANLQENPGGLRKADAEAQPLREDEEYDAGTGQLKPHRRNRSETVNSGSTNNSLSSRGDLILSDEEEDAREIDDEFAIILGRRTTSTSGRSEDQISAKTGSSGRRQRVRSRRSTRTVSSKSLKSTKMNRTGSHKSLDASQRLDTSVEDLESVDAPNSTAHEVSQDASSEHDEHLEIAQKRQEQVSLTKDGPMPSTMEIKPYPGVITARAAAIRREAEEEEDDDDDGTEPFPSLMEPEPPDPPPPPGDVQNEHPT